jgi:hypothetical protein
MQRIQLTDETYVGQPSIEEVIKAATRGEMLKLGTAEKGVAPAPHTSKVPFTEPDFEIIDPCDSIGMARARGYAANPKGKLPIVNVRRTRERGSLVELDTALALNEKNARAAAAKASGQPAPVHTPAKMSGRDSFINQRQAETRGFVHTSASAQATGADAAPRMSGRDEWIAKQQCAAPEALPLLPQELGDK